MQLETSARNGAQRRIPLQERVLGEMAGEGADALVFAASSVINEITSPAFDGQTVERTVQTERGEYTLRGGRVFGADGGEPVVLIYAGAIRQTPEAEPDLAHRFHLTRKEARVARMLAQQKTNAEIARSLCISTHTARHHTQAVLGKLGINSRRQVAALLSS